MGWASVLGRAYFGVGAWDGCTATALFRDPESQHVLYDYTPSTNTVFNIELVLGKVLNLVRKNDSL